MGEDEAGSLGVSQINSSSCSLLSGGVKAWWQTASTSDGTNCHWQPLTLLPFWLRRACVCVCVDGWIQVFLHQWSFLAVLASRGTWNICLNVIRVFSVIDMYDDVLIYQNMANWLIQHQILQIKQVCKVEVGVLLPWVSFWVWITYYQWTEEWFIDKLINSCNL